MAPGAHGTWIPLDSGDEWRAALRGVPHAFGHTWENCHSMALTTGYETYLYRYDADGHTVVCPVAERPFRGHVDILTPYGFSGFAGTAAQPEFGEEWRQETRQRGYVCGYIGLNPLLCTPEWGHSTELHTHNQIYALDLQLDTDELHANLSSARRRQLRKWPADVELVFERDRLKRFVAEHYRAFFQRKKAGAAYQFRRQTIEDLADHHNVMLLGVEGSDGLEEVMMLAFTPHAAEYVMSISNDDARRHAAHLIWEGVSQLKKRRVPWFNLGGGVHPGDGVARFKEHFGGRVFPLQSLKQVYDPESFRALCERAGADPQDLSGYFPPYHAPSPIPGPHGLDRNPHGGRKSDESNL